MYFSETLNFELSTKQYRGTQNAINATPYQKGDVEPQDPKHDF